MWKEWLQGLHKGAAWYGLPAKQQNTMQRLAAHTSGLITPANIVSISGAVLVLVGLWYFYHHALAAGIAFITLGRLADILDGFVARRTGTSSPFGEGLDASLDKLVILATTVILVAMTVIPTLVAIFLLLEQTATAALTLMARRHGKLLHPTRLGKIVTFCTWVVLILYIVAYWLVSTMLFNVANFGAACIILLGAISVARYAHLVHTYHAARVKNRYSNPLHR